MKVSYKGKFPTGSFLNEDIGFEIEIPSNTDEEALKAVSHLRDLAEKAHRERYPDPIDPNEEIKVVQKEKDNRGETIQQLILEIQSCKDQKNLDVYKYLLKQYPEIQDAYNQQLLIIQNKQ